MKWNFPAQKYSKRRRMLWKAFKEEHYSYFSDLLSNNLILNFDKTLLDILVAFILYQLTLSIYMHYKVAIIDILGTINVFLPIFLDDDQHIINALKNLAKSIFISSNAQLELTTFLWYILFRVAWYISFGKQTRVLIALNILVALWNSFDPSLRLWGIF